MKAKFIITIFLSLLITVGAVTMLHFSFFRSERLRLIDNQIQASASLLLSSDLSRVPLHDIEEAEEYFSDLLGNDSFNKLILLRDFDGSVLYSSRNAEWLPQDSPDIKTWKTRIVDGHTIRLFTVRVPQIGRVLQIGMVLDTQLLRWQQIDEKFLLYVGAIIFMVLLVSILVATLLLRPLRNLASYLDYLSQGIDDGLPTKHFEIPLKRTYGKDEFDRLAVSVSQLTEKIGLNLRTFRVWAAQLAHEMKTPLTITRNCVESFLLKKEFGEPQLLREAIDELDRLDSTINSFLAWAAAENSVDARKDIRALSLARVVEDVVVRLSRVYPERIQLTVRGDSALFANPQYVEQLVSNLLSNALKYSSPGKAVEVVIDAERLVVKDQGEGVPIEVMKKLGEPFNVYPQKGVKGTGLGLAWVNTICKKYGWRFSLEPSTSGTLAVVDGFG